MKSSKVFGLLAMVIVFLILAINGTMSYEDEKLEEALYCKMVAEGSWPAYSENIDCK